VSSDLVVVELAGTPGAGKTTVAAALVQELRGRGLSASTIVGAARLHARRTAAGQLVARIPHDRLRRLLLWYVFYVAGTAHGVAFAARHRRLVRHLVRARRSSRAAGGAVGRTHAAFWYVQLCGRVAFLRATARPGEILVIDDGFLHRAVHLHASTRSNVDVAAVREYVSLVPRPELAVRLVVPDDTCRARVRARGVWAHARDLDDAGLDGYVTSARRVSDVATDRAAELSWNLVTVDNHGRSVTDVAAVVTAVVDGIGTARATPLQTRTRVPRLPRPSRVRALAAGRFGPAVLPPDRVRAVLDAYGLAAGAGQHSDLRVGRRSLNAAVPTRRGVKVVKRYRPQWTEPLVEHGHSILRRL